MMTVMRSTKQLMMLLGTLSLLLAVTSCRSAVPRPDTSLCIVNVPKLHEKCYNFKTDYDDNGDLKPDAKPTFIQYKDDIAMLIGLNKKTSITPDGLARLEAYIRDLRAEQGRRGD